MDATAINSVVQRGLDQVSTYMTGPFGIIIGSIIGIVLLISIIGLIFSVVRGIRGGS